MLEGGDIGEVAKSTEKPEREYPEYEGIPPEVVKDIIDSAEEGYRYAGAGHRSNACFDVVDGMGRYLLNTLGKGYAAARVNSSFLFTPHRMISIIPPEWEGKDPIIADPTWQQFFPSLLKELDEKRVTYPKVLIGTRAQLGKQLEGYSLDEDERIPWAGKKERRRSIWDDVR